MKLRVVDPAHVALAALRDHRLGDAVMDKADIEIAYGRAQARRAHLRPLQGDLLLETERTLEWLKPRRIAHVWWADDEDGYEVEMIQPTDKPGGGSFHLNEDGRGSYSGGLDTGIKGDVLEDTGGWIEQPFWFFHHGNSGAHRGVEVSVPVRIWRIVASA